jgi:ligand-binding SRPBCC domain-containing protein
MHTYHLRCRMLVPLPLARVFEVFENPYNLAKITPPWLGFEVTSRDKVVMRAGAEIEYRIRWLGLPLRWKTRITSYDPPFSFTDEQERGPYPLWRHRHSFQPTPEGVLVGDHVEYALPFGPLGRMAHKLVVGNQLRRIFNYRQEKLAEMFGVACPILLAPEISTRAGSLPEEVAAHGRARL